MQNTHIDIIQKPCLLYQDRKVTVFSILQHSLGKALLGISSPSYLAEVLRYHHGRRMQQQNNMEWNEYNIFIQNDITRARFINATIVILATIFLLEPYACGRCGKSYTASSFSQDCNVHQPNHSDRKDVVIIPLPLPPQNIFDVCKDVE